MNKIIALLVVSFVLVWMSSFVGKLFFYLLRSKKEEEERQESILKRMDRFIEHPAKNFTREEKKHVVLENELAWGTGPHLDRIKSELSKMLKIDANELHLVRSGQELLRWNPNISQAEFWQQLKIKILMDLLFESLEEETALKVVWGKSLSIAFTLLFLKKDLDEKDIWMLIFEEKSFKINKTVASFDSSIVAQSYWDKILRCQQKIKKIQKLRPKGEDESVKKAYKVLKLHEGEPFDHVKKAHKRLVKKTHPDRGGNSEDFQKVHEAFGILEHHFKWEREARKIIEDISI